MNPTIIIIISGLLSVINVVGMPTSFTHQKIRAFQHLALKFSPSSSCSPSVLNISGTG